MTSPGGNIVEIRVVSKDLTGPGFDSATRRAKGLAQAVSGGPNSAGAALADASRKSEGFAGSLKRVGEIAGGVLVAGMVQSMAHRARQLISSTVEAASSLGESVNAVNKTFGASSTTVLQWGRDNANSFGLSQRAYNESIVPLGAMLKNQGLSLGEVTEQTIKLTKRAADMGSVFNVDVSPVLQAIQAGLRGEIDPLERFGVSLSAAAVEQRALADSGKTAAKELTAQEKAVARLNLIYDQTADTEGDFAATSEGLANTTRKTTGTLEDAQAKIGTVFIPAFTKAQIVTGDLASAFADLPGPIQAVIAGAAGLGVVMVLLVPKLTAASTAMVEMGIASQSSATALMGMGKAAGLAGVALGAVKIAEQIGPLRAMGDALDNAAAKMGLFSQEAADNKTLFEVVFGEWLGWTKKDAPQTIARFGDLAEGIKDVGNAAEDATPQVEDLDTALTGMIDNAFGFEEAQDRAADAVARLKRQVQEQRDAHVKGAGSLKGNTQAARDNRAAVLNVVDAYKDMIVKAEKTGHSTKGLTDRLEDQLVKMGLDRTEAHKYVAELERLRVKAAQIKSKSVEIKVKVNWAEENRPTGVFEAHGGIIGAPAGSVSRAAAGGIRSARTIVGEFGPEFVDLPFGSTVHTAASTRAMLAREQSTGSSYTVNVYPSPFANPRDVGAEVIRAIQAYERGNGKGWQS